MRETNWIPTLALLIIGSQRQYTDSSAGSGSIDPLNDNTQILQQEVEVLVLSTTIQILQQEVEVLALSMTIHRFFSRKWKYWSSQRQYTDSSAGSGSIGPLNDNTDSSAGSGSIGPLNDNTQILQQEVEVLVISTTIHRFFSRKWKYWSSQRQYRFFSRKWKYWPSQ